MKKDNKKQQDVWGEGTVEDNQEIVETVETVEETVIPASVNDLKPSRPTYTLAGLKADFQNVKDLQQFVFDETNVSLKLQGVEPDVKFKVALAVLNNEDIDPVYLTNANPYVENKELIPEDPIKPIPMRDKRLPSRDTLQNVFHSFNVPHPDTEMRALDAKVRVAFRKYQSGEISYEVEGPLEKHSIGEKMDKYGRARPEKYVWVDPRTGEQLLRSADGSFTKMGQRLRTLMESYRVNKNESQWSMWVDRDFTSFNQNAIDNPWDEK